MMTDERRERATYRTRLASSERPGSTIYHPQSQRQESKQDTNLHSPQILSNFVNLDFRANDGRRLG
jgi:hypothetical protein